ncbi:hypothetical protein PENTCL1PPCAC_15555, partial [Pristionchus entomophagus]
RLRLSHFLSPEPTLSSHREEDQTPATMFTARICCCSATAASKIMAFIAVIMAGWVAIQAWFDPIQQWIGITIWQSILLVILILSGILVFIACSRRNPTLMIPIIIIQAISFLTILGDAIYYLIWMTTGYSLWNWIYTAAMYAITVIVSGFVLHCHTCCYKLLILKAHHHHHGGV